MTNGNNRAGWILTAVALVSFFGGMGAWGLKEWISWKKVETYVSASDARDLQLSVWRLGADRELATLTRDQCLLFRMVNLDRARNRLRLLVVPV